jgi:glycine hydroxymethyltransferase
MCRENYAKIMGSRVFPGTQGGPLMHVIAAKAVAFKEALTDEFKAYQNQIVKNAKALAAGLMEEGFRLVSGGTDNHLMLVDLTDKEITGKEAQEILDITGITVNKNGIPFDTKGPMITSGIRIGTPAVTTRGMKEGEMKQIAAFISLTLKNGKDEGKIREIQEGVRELCEKFPLYKERIARGRAELRQM